MRGQYLDIQFSRAQKINSVSLAVLDGDQRSQRFTLQAILADGSLHGLQGFQTSFSTLDLETFAYTAAYAVGLRITGYGNSDNPFINLNEVEY